MPRRKKPAVLDPQTTFEALVTLPPQVHETPISTAAVQSVVSVDAPDDNLFPIVGIGASAGGLAAIETLFRAMPSDTGMAFVVVQHLDPTHESLLVEIVRRFTKMMVHQVEDEMTVEPNCIYIIPPNREMALSDNRLLLTEPPERRGFRLPIDAFFGSLAETRSEQAIGIVLSGTGSDGTLGLKEIHRVGGLTIAQDPKSAQYDGMPRSAIDSGAANFVLTPDKMPAQLARFVQDYLIPLIVPPILVPASELNAVEAIFVLLRRQTKHDFSGYKRNTIIRRIQRRMVLNKVESYTDYVAIIQQEADEIQRLFQSLLIGVTSFFRDTAVFEVLERNVIVHLGESSQTHRPFRVWVAGCSTGEEAYSIAILLYEHMSEQGWSFEVDIFATDIDAHSIAQARLGVYPDSIAATMSPERLHRFFVKDGRNYRVVPSIREMIVFAVQSVTKDPPFSRMNLISCRNLLIYLDPDLQKKVIALFHYGLTQDGFLLLGPSESLGYLADYFHTIDRRTKLFQKNTAKSILQEPSTIFFPVSPSEITPMPSIKKSDKTVDIRELVENALLQTFMPPCIIVNEQSEVLYFHGKLAGYLAPSSGPPSMNILRLVREDLRVPIGAALHKVFEHKDAIISEKLYLNDDRSGPDLVLTVKSLPDQPMFMVIFEEIIPSSDNRPKMPDGEEAAPDAHPLSVRHIEGQLQATRNYLQATIEELETSNQELRSTNEELQAANEELQSTNEEIETSKEELQSVNEELVTLNSELQSSLETLGRTTNDLNNLLVNLDVAIVFLDIHLNINRFNASATQLINLIPTDIGRPISHLVSNLAYDGLLSDAQRVLDSLLPVDKEIQTLEGRWFLMRIRLYRTIENAIMGLVITFSEITMQKTVQDQLHLARDYAQNIIETIRESLIVLNPLFQIVSASRSFYRMFQLKPESTVGKSIYDISDKKWDIPQLRELLEQILPEHNAFEDYPVMYDFPIIGQRSLMLNAKQIYNVGGNPELILLAFEDVTNNHNG